MTISQLTSSTLAAIAAKSGNADAIASAAVSERDHYDKLANFGANIVGEWDFRTPRCRVPVALNAEIPSLVRGGDPAIMDRVTGMALTANALRLTGSSQATTPRIRLPLSVAPETGLKQLLVLIGCTVVAAPGGTGGMGLMHCGNTTSGISVTLTNGSNVISGRIDNANVGATDGEETTIFPIYPTVSIPSTFTVGTPFISGIGYYNAGTATLRSIRYVCKDKAYANRLYTNDGTLSDEGLAAPIYIGENGLHSNVGLTLDIHRIVVAKWLTANGEPPQELVDISKLNDLMYGGDIRAGYTP